MSAVLEPIEITFTVTETGVAEATASVKAKADIMFGDKPYQISSIKGVESEDSDIFTWTAIVVEVRDRPRSESGKSATSQGFSRSMFPGMPPLPKFIEGS